MWDLDKAVKHLEAHGGNHSQGRCAQFVREAVEAGGVTLTRHVSAKDYGSSLERIGFVAVSDALGVRAGDVAIIQPIPGHPHGHMVMFSGKIWISDFKQWRGLYPGKAYREHKPLYQIYRNTTKISEAWNTFKIRQSVYA